jgi:hypothetical protein
MAGTLAMLAWMGWLAAASWAEKKDLHVQAREVLLSVEEAVDDLRKALKQYDIGEARSAAKRALARVDRTAALVAKAGPTPAEELALGFIADGRRYLEEVVLLIDDAAAAHKEALKAAKLAEKQRIEELRAAIKAGTPPARKDADDEEDEDAENEQEDETDEEWKQILDEAVVVLRGGRAVYQRGLEAFPRRR